MRSQVQSQIGGATEAATTDGALVQGLVAVDSRLSSDNSFIWTPQSDQLLKGCSRLAAERDEQEIEPHTKYVKKSEDAN